ncbi:c-type cytochrome [Flavobacterium sp.]|uniref:c-type cytochrome n=1 Tax=Flavobacterium sp. TaxID=239 RepID=UPI003528184F
MKKIVLFVVVVMVFSCRNTKEEPFWTDSKVVSEGTNNSGDEKIKEGEKLFNGVGLCYTCHKPNQKVIGPSIAEIATVYKEKEANMVEFLKGNGKPIVDPSQYEVMKANFAITKKMKKDELEAIEHYIYSFSN